MDIVDSVRMALKASSDELTRLDAQRFFKEEIRSYGVKSAAVKKISKTYFKLIKGKDEIFGLCEALWQSGYLEEAGIACEWSYYMRNQYAPEDFEVFDRWANSYVNNWAACDALCNHTVGSFIEMFPSYVEKLKGWANSENRWVRRASAVSLIVPARKGLFLNDVFEIADILLMDKDDLVQKGYGWMLKSASQAHTDAVYRYVISKKAAMPRTALRYAIEKMPACMRSEAMKK